jgi:putative sigma-54 modulation protein
MNRIEIKTIHTDITKDTSEYINEKVSKLDNYLSRHARKSVYAEVRLSETSKSGKQQCTAEASVYLPGEVITAKETTVNMYAAIDIVEEKLKSQLRKYKAANSAKRGHRETQVRVFLGKIVRKKTN